MFTESFQTKILNPELTSSEEESLQAAARAMYSTYLAAGTPPLAADLAAELQALMLQDNSINKYVVYNYKLYSLILTLINSDFSFWPIKVCVKSAAFFFFSLFRYCYLA